MELHQNVKFERRKKFFVMSLLVLTMIAGGVIQFLKIYDATLIVYTFYETVVAIIMTSFIFTTYFFIQIKFKYINSLK